mmetsp:Transcript_30441/g.81000  ORF Transcript_30441/g.81000 Transcript_30441/m.81000 type:complete len:1277 (+) Transcript_30441:517-4347(+)
MISGLSSLVRFSVQLSRTHSAAMVLVIYLQSSLDSGDLDALLIVVCYFMPPFYDLRYWFAGRYAETTTISVDLGDFIYNEVKYNPSKQPCSVDSPNPPCQYLGAVNRSVTTSPKFKYNIYSTTMGDYLWDQDVDANTIRRVEVPDGEFQLYLYQTQKTSEAVDLVDIYQALNTVPSTVPARSAERDFDYGDPREYLATTSALISDINQYCWGPNQAAHNYVCDWHPSLDTTITALASYGVAGSVLMSTGMRKTSTLAEVNFCGALPQGSLGLTNTSNRDYLRSLAIACPHRRRLPPPMTQSLSESAGADTPRAVGTGAVGSRCVAHSQCDQSVRDPFYNHTGLFCARSSSSVDYGTCAYCAFCQADSAGISPCLAQCGLVGDAPECISAARLVADFQCQSTFNFSVYRFNPPGQAPTVVPGSQPTLPELTQHNLLVGPLMITQVRRAHVPCSDAGNGPLRALVNRTSCLGPRDGSPFGVDPTYLPASQTYNGKLLMSDAYNVSTEVRAISTTASSGTVFTKMAPYGFFPHQYDGVTFGPKEENLISKADVDTFKVYFDGVLTLSQANAMLSYMQDGGFIDNQTSSISLDMITYSSDLNLFSILVITFDWQDGGSISWDYRLHSRRVDLYTLGDAQRGLEYTSLVLLGLFMAVDLRRFYVRLRSAKLGSLFSFDTLLEWGHWALMAYTWATWYRLCDKAASFRMLTQQDYWVLANPTANTRMLQTNSTSESSFLALHALVTDYVLNSSEHYNALASCSLVLFVIRVLRSLEFQAHLGVITRTITAAWSNLLHFVVLLVAVFIGYAVAGHLIFGHEFHDMSTVEDSMVMHFWIILTFDPTIFYDQTRHAAPEWIFHIYVWTFLVLCGYLLFNIFLAILVDAYMIVRQTAILATPLHEDIAAVVTHAAKALVLPREVFVSDWDLRRRLVLLLNVTQRQRAVLPRRRQVLDLLAAALQHNGRSLQLPGGVEITGRVLRALAKTPAQDPQASAVAPLGGEELADEDDEQEAWVEDLLARYSDPINAAELEAAVVADVRAESLKRDLSTYRVHQRVHDAVARVDALLDLVAAKVLGVDALDKARAAAPVRAISNSSAELLQVTVLKARDLPKKDILRALDPFCLVCLTSDPRNPTGKHTYKTRVVTGERNPEWNERFMFPLATDSRTSPLLSLVVMDFDKCSVDDLVGVVGINVMRDVPPPGAPCLEQWFPIQADPPLKSAAVLLRLERLGKPDPSLPSDPPPPPSPTPAAPAPAAAAAANEGASGDGAMELLSVGQGDEQA